MLKLSYAVCLGLSPIILAQFTLEVTLQLVSAACYDE